MDGIAYSDELAAAACPVVAEPYRVLFASSEIYPLAKTGGLADVCAGLPRAMAALGTDLRLVMPAYTAALEQVLCPRVVLDLGNRLGAGDVRVLAGRTPDSALPVWLIDCPALYRRDGGPYADRSGREWDDNGLRFAVFCHAVARLARQAGSALGWKPDIVHCHDWHTGLVPALLAGEIALPSVFTIHNAAFQGNQPLTEAARYELAAAVLGCDGAEFYGQLSFLKAGIRYADRVTTVSPTYARELLTVEHGCGMHGVLGQRAAAFSGIVNGIDTELWNPARDPHLPAAYSAAERAGKAACKAALQAELGLAVDRARPLAIMVSRLTHQKMADVVLDELPGLLAAEPDLQLAVLGCGDQDAERRFSALAAQHAGRVSVHIGYDEPSAHRLHAGADLLVHGSRFEPCGLVQLYAMRYGTLPLVNRVGGLADTVVDIDCGADATGFVFDGCHGAALRGALQRALGVFRTHPDAWRRLQNNAMRRDSGWRASARQYLALYAAMRPGRAVRPPLRRAEPLCH